MSEAENTAPALPEFVPFDDLNNVPEVWKDRWLREGRLSLEQWNAVAEYAHDNPAVSLDEEGNPASYAPNYALAVKWFAENHEAKGGLWVPKGGK